MSLSIRTNISSLNAQRNLSANQVGLDSSLSRLSSGFRITKAGDDAAGLGISTKLESQIRSYNQAVRNANDGISVVQSTEAALNEQANILTRMRELAMQSASDGVGNAERGYIQKESSRLLAELQRISQVAEYNGTKLLDGAAATLDFQVGIAATANDVISLTTLNATTAAPTAAGATGPGTVSAAGPSVSAEFTAAATFYLNELATNGWDETAARNATEALGVPDPATAVAMMDAIHEMFYVSYMTGLGAFAGFPSTVPAGAARDNAVAVVTAAAGGGAGGDPSLAAAFGAFAATVAGGGDTALAQNAAEAAATAVNADNDYQAGLSARLMFEAATGAPFGATVAPGAALDLGLAALGFGYVPGAPAAAANPGGLNIAGLSLSSKAAALSSLASIDAALGTISSNRATLGAAGNRFQSAISNIQAFSESLSAANSRIKDVDVAEETSRMSRSQILLQAGVSVLAQANQAPQMALKLLG